MIKLSDGVALGPQQWNRVLAQIHAAVDDTVLRVLPARFPNMFPARVISEKHHLYDETKPKQELPGTVSCTFGVFSPDGTVLLELSYGVGFCPRVRESVEAATAYALSRDKENSDAVHAAAKKAALHARQKRDDVEELLFFEENVVLWCGSYLWVLCARDLSPDFVQAVLLYLCLRLTIPHDPHRENDRAKADEYAAKVEMLSEQAGFGPNPKRAVKNLYFNRLSTIGR